MARGFDSFLLMQFLIAEVLTQTQPSLSQYLQLAGLGPYGPPVPQNSAQSNYPTAPYPNYSTQQTPPKVIVEAPRSNTASIPLSAIANMPSSPVPTSPPKPPPVPKQENIPTAGLDPNVLNNLAIALQLLIVSNILSTPPTEFPPLPKLELQKYEVIPKYELAPPLALSYSALQNPYAESPRTQSFYYESTPNAKFLGSSGFVEPSMLPAMAVRHSPRSNVALISPYEAIGSGSPYSDPILSSSYAPSYSKQDFQSPYAAILNVDGNRDFFSVADLF